MQSQTIIGLLFNHAQHTPNKIAVVFENQLITYDELKKNILKSAELLTSQGVKSGDRVLLYTHNHPDFIYAYFATHLLSAIATPLDNQSTQIYCDFIINQIQPRYIFKLSSTPSLSVSPELSFSPEKIDNKNIADILFTTGTTGKPKGVVLTHEAILSAAININTFIKNTADDVEVVSIPFSHSFGLGRLRCVMLRGGTIILINGLHTINSLFHALSHHKATGLSIVPAGIAILLKLTKDKLAEYANQLNYIEIGSAPMLTEHKQKLITLLPRTRICMHYGLTEASRSTFICLQNNKFNSIGKAAPNVKIKIIDEDGITQPPLSRGELCIQGDHLMQGYWKDEIQTKRALIDNWLHTADMGYQDEEGYIYLEGRKQDIINVGGKKVSPIEIESCLKEHPAIADCACIGIPCPQGIAGEAIKAFITLADTVQSLPSPPEIINFLRKSLEAYKIPLLYEQIEKIPRTHSGKIQRSVLREGK